MTDEIIENNPTLKARTELQKIEGIITKVIPWERDHTKAFIELFDNQSKFFCKNGKILHPGVSCWFEIKKGDGDLSDYWEIVNSEQLKVNQEVKQIPNQPLTPGQNLGVQMPFQTFQDIVKQKDSIKVAKIEALVQAVSVFKERGEHIKMESDMVRLGKDILQLARVFEDYLNG